MFRDTWRLSEGLFVCISCAGLFFIVLCVWGRMNILYCIFIIRQPSESKDWHVVVVLFSLFRFFRNLVVFCPTLLPRRKNNNNMSYANTPREIAIPHTPSMIRNNLSFDTKNQIVRRRIHRPTSVQSATSTVKLDLTRNQQTTNRLHAVMMPYWL